MLNLLKYQFRKLFRNVVFYIIIGLVLIQNVISIFDFTGKDAYFVDYILRFDQYNLIMFGAAVFVPLFACGDYANGAVKTVFGKGYTRTQNFISKLIACLAANIMICGLQIGLMLILGASVIPNSGFTPKLAGEAAYMLFLFAFCEVRLYLRIFRGFGSRGKSDNRGSRKLFRNVFIDRYTYRIEYGSFLRPFSMDVGGCFD